MGNGGVAKHWIRASLIPSTASGLVVALVLGMGFNIWMVQLHPEDISTFRPQISQLGLCIIGVAGAISGLLIGCGYCLVVWVAEKLLNRKSTATTEV
jgi:membrane associated rhomboid family serine protease